MNIESQEKLDSDIRKRQRRQFYPSYCRWLWSPFRDVRDIYDLRYLFDDEEIATDKCNLISAEEDGPWFGNHQSDLMELIDVAPPNEVLHFDHDELDYDENWDDDVHEIYFDYRLGWFTNDYDSGYDEPYKRGQPYLSQDEDEDFEDDNEPVYWDF